MDIIIHTLSGLAVSSVVASYAKNNKTGIIFTGGIAGAFPDLDAISLWSKFDSTIGKWFDLPSGSDIYFGHYWYSHHAILHSLLAATVFSICIYFINKKKSNAIYFGLAAFLGYFIHLIEDMPTPGSIWGGVNLFFPSRVYVGGTGKIWWWNNYDIFLIVLSVFMLNILFILLLKEKSKIITTAIFSLGLMLCLYQINNRGFNFDYEGHNAAFRTLEEKSLEIQKKILGERVFSLMKKLDSKVGVNF